MIIEKRIKIPIYNHTFTLVVFNDSKEFYGRFKGYNHEEVNPDNCNGLAFQHKGREYLALKKKDITHGIIAHEAFHIMTSLFKTIGVGIYYDNDEPGAYLLGFIIDEIYKHVKVK